MILFSLGYLVAIVHGVEKFNHAEPFDEAQWAIGILMLGIVLDLAPTPLPRAALTSGQLSESIEGILGNDFLSQRAEEVGRWVAPRPTPRIAADAILATRRV